MFFNFLIFAFHCLFIIFFSSKEKNKQATKPIFFFFFSYFHLCDSNPKRSSHSSGTGHSVLSCKAPGDGPLLRCPVLLGIMSHRNCRNESVIGRFLQPNFIAQRQDVSFLSLFVFHLTPNIFKAFPQDLKANLMPKRGYIHLLLYSTKLSFVNFRCLSRGWENCFCVGARK